MPQYHIGRQPIFDANMELHAYELLFRNNASENSAEFNDDQATLQVINNTLSEIGLENLVGRHPVFVNLTRDNIKIQAFRSAWLLEHKERETFFRRVFQPFFDGDSVALGF